MKDHSKHEVVLSSAAGKEFQYCRDCKEEVIQELNKELSSMADDISEWLDDIHSVKRPEKKVRDGSYSYKIVPSQTGPGQPDVLYELVPEHPIQNYLFQYNFKSLLMGYRIKFSGDI